VNGLDLVFHSRGVFTGAGTLAREAACLGVPSCSFFGGKTLLAVDRRLIDEGKMYFSRDPDLLLEEFSNMKPKANSLSRAKEVKGIVMDRLEEIMQGRDVSVR
jgi:predicted glycosyltransferase